MSDRATPSHIEIAYSSIRCFSDDGELDLGELNFLLGLALRDGTIDDDERRVLASVFNRAGTVAPAVAARIAEVRRLHQI